MWMKQVSKQAILIKYKTQAAQLLKTLVQHVKDFHKYVKCFQTLK